MEKTIKPYRKHLTTLTTHLRKYEKPINGYGLFATSYISGDIPWKKILSEEATSEEADPVPFSPKFEIETFALQEKERKLRGESVRKKEILNPEEIFQDFKQAHISDSGERLNYLYFKAMQYSEVNKALALDEKYPKPDENALRSTYSKEHQEAMREARRKEREEKGEAPSELDEKLISVPNVEAFTFRNSHRMATTEEMEDLKKFRQVIKDALDKPTAFKDFELTKEPWQFKATGDRPLPQPLQKRKKPPWRKNVYPPKSKEERIAELRAKAPPMDPEYLQIDKLPGLWEPELMVDTFKTAYMEAKERKCYEDPEGEWEKRFETNKKCSQWLNSIPDSL